MMKIKFYNGEIKYMVAVDSSKMKLLYVYAQKQKIHQLRSLPILRSSSV